MPAKPLGCASICSLHMGSSFIKTLKPAAAVEQPQLCGSYLLSMHGQRLSLTAWPGTGPLLKLAVMRVPAVSEWTPVADCGDSLGRSGPGGRGPHAAGGHAEHGPQSPQCNTDVRLALQIPVLVDQYAPASASLCSHCTAVALMDSPGGAESGLACKIQQEPRPHHTCPRLLCMADRSMERPALL